MYTYAHPWGNTSLRRSLRGLVRSARDASVEALLDARSIFCESRRCTRLAVGLTDRTGIVLTPGIAVRSGQRLTRKDRDWILNVVDATKAESALLVQNEQQIEEAIEQDRVVVAFDRLTGQFAGCLFPWHLTDAGDGLTWTEIGTIFVPLEFRFGKTHLRICERLLAIGLRQRERLGEGVLMTTTNPTVIKHGQRQGMEVRSFHNLPPDVHSATCCCPSSKTGTDDNVNHCRQKDTKCRVLVSAATARALRTS